ncbi:MAG: S8 family serine peptidase [Actinomycetota bacterium]
MGRQTDAGNPTGGARTRPRRGAAAALVIVAVAALSGQGTSAAGSTRAGVRVSALPVLGSAHAGRPAGAPTAARPGRPRFRAPSSRLFSSDPALLRLRGHRRVVVMVKLDYEAVARYAGGLPGLPPTSPDVTGRSIGRDSRSPAVTAYERYQRRFDGRVLRRVRLAVPDLRVLYRYHLAYGGLALELPAGRVAALARTAGVVAVQRATVEHPLTDVTPGFLHATDVWPSLGGSTTAGSNVIVGVIDTGIWPEHPSFADLGLDPVPGQRGCQFGDGSDPKLGPAFACNDKLIGAYAFTATYLSQSKPLVGEFCDAATSTCSARDSDGHGTHTASTAAGDANRDATIFGVHRGLVSGMAPGARIIAYRICLTDGCYGPDAVAAVNQAIADGVGVINYSISGGTAYGDPVEQAFLDAYAAGILVNAAAGNAGPGPGTVNHISPWENTVGAATSPRQFRTTVHLAATGGATLDVDGASLTDGLTTPAPVVQAADVAGYGDPLCASPLPSGSVTGKLVVCIRGGDTARVDKGLHVQQGGGAGMLLLNPVVEDVETDNHWLPAVHLDFPEAQQVLSFLGSHASVTGSFPQGLAVAAQPDVVAAFSSRGPGGDFVKPDVLAPGVQVLAGRSPEPIATFEGPPGQLYQAIAGTSMASPHGAGLSALLEAVHPDWTPGQVKSALMTSAVQDAVEEDGTTPANPFDQGAGRIRADVAASPTLTFDVTAQQYRDAVPDDGGGGPSSGPGGTLGVAAAGDPQTLLDLNVPSVDVPILPGKVTAHRTALNVSRSAQTFHAVTVSPPDSTITVTPSDFTVGTGGTVDLAIQIDASALPDGQYFGSVLLDAQDPSATDVRLPVAFHRQQGPVKLATSCDDTSLTVGQTATCTVTVSNTAGGSSGFDLSVATDADPAHLAITSPSKPAHPSGNGFTVQDTLSPYTSPLITQLKPDSGPAFVDLAARGISPVLGMRDESLVNVGTPGFQFGGRRYTAVAMTSNGCAVLGGAGPGAVSTHTQHFPDPALPNDVIAPMWTDLDPGAGGHVYAGKVLRAGVRWVVLEWRRVPTYHTTQLQTFEIWIRTGSVQTVSVVYARVTGPGAPTGRNEGAENIDGTSGLDLAHTPVAGERFVVRTSGPRPGETETITYHVGAGAPGDYRIASTLEAEGNPGLTIRFLDFTVSG